MSECIGGESQHVYGALLSLGGKKVHLNDALEIVDNVSTQCPQMKAAPMGKKVKFIASSNLPKTSVDETSKILQTSTSRPQWVPGLQRMGYHISGSMDSLSSDASDEIFCRSYSSSSATGCQTESHYAEVKRSHDINKLISVCSISFCFMIIILIGAYFSNSIAVYFLGLHVVCNTLGYLISIMVLRKSTQSIKINLRKYQAEILGTLVTVLMTWLSAGFAGDTAVRRFLAPNFLIDPDVMLGISIVAFSVNILNAIIVLDCNRYFGYISHINTSLMSRRAVLTYFAASVMIGATCLTAAILYKIEDIYAIADPICALACCVIAVMSTWVFLWDLWQVLLGRCPTSVNLTELLRDLTGVPGIKGAHDLHVWPLSFDCNAMSVHITIDASFNSDPVVKNVQKLIQTQHRILHSTIQVETYSLEMQPQRKYSSIN